jgi:hypothetical protein
MIAWVLCGLLAWAGEDATKVNQLGPVTVTTTLAPAEPTIGDEITLEIRVEAEPDVEVLMPEFGEALSRYTILNFVPQQRIDDRGKTVLTQRYTLQPYLSGAQSIPPILIEFIDHRSGQKPSPDDFDAYEILTDRIDFLVKSVVPSDTARELKPPLGELDLLPERSRSVVLGTVLGSIATVCAVVAAWMVWRRRRRRARRRNAYEVARTRLNQLLSRPWPQDAAAVASFFVAISSIVRRYLEDRFDLRAPELTTEEFLALAGSASNLSRDHQHLLRDFLRQADLVKFAGVRASEEEIRRSSDLAARFLEETRENAPLIDDPDATGHPPPAGSQPGSGVTEKTHV